MDDLISKAELKRLTTKRNSIWNEITDAEGRGLDQILDSMPTVDAVPTDIGEDIDEILRYLDAVVHPLLSPENWNVYAQLHDMVSSIDAVPECREERREEWTKE